MKRRKKKARLSSWLRYYTNWNELHELFTVILKLEVQHENLVGFQFKYPVDLKHKWTNLHKIQDKESFHCVIRNN
jgi:hypothetical protein